MLEGKFQEKLAYIQTKELLKRDREVDAIFCISDLMAFGVCQAVEEAGLTVGKDIAVVGFDNIPTAQYVFGGLTTVHQDFLAMGYTAGAKVFEQISGRKSVGSPGDLMYKLIVRGSAPDVSAN